MASYHLKIKDFITWRAFEFFQLLMNLSFKSILEIRSLEERKIASLILS